MCFSYLYSNKLLTYLRVFLYLTYNKIINRSYKLRKFIGQGLEATVLNDSLGTEVAQRPNQSEAGRASTSVVNTQSIDERGWVLSQTVVRPSLVSTIEWNITHTPGTVLASYNLPRDLIVNSLNSAPFAAFKYWRGNISLQMQVNGSPMHQGIVKAVFIPLTFGTASLTRVNPVDVSINEHVTLFANSSSSVKIDIPFVSPLNYLDVTPTYELERSLGTLHIVVWNKLAAPINSSTAVSISLFASMPGSEFKVPRLQQFVAQGVLNTVSENDDASRGSIPSVYENTAPAVFTSVGPMNYAEGKTHVEKLTPFPHHVAKITNADTVTSKDEMSLEYLLTKPSYLGSFNVTINDMPGYGVASFPVNPIAKDFGKNVFRPTLLGYLSMPFQFWQGSLKYRFEFAATSMQTCKLFVAFNPGVFKVQAYSLQEVTAQYGMTIDLAQGGNVFDYEVPYIAPSPFLEVPHSTDSADGVTVFNTVGMLNVVVLNRLIAPHSLPTTINCNVYISAGENFRLMNLSACNLWRPVDDIPGDDTVAEEPIPEFESQGNEPQDAFNETPVAERKIIDSNPIAKDVIKPFKPGTINPGLTMSVADYCKKFQLVEFTTSSTPRYKKIDLRDMLAITLTSRPKGLLTWFPQMYRSIHGGLRFKITIRDSLTIPSIMGQFRVYYLPPLTYTGGYNSITAGFNGQFSTDPSVPLTRLNVSVVNSIDRTLYFEVPYSVMLNFNLLTNSIDSTYSNSIFTDFGSIYIVNDADDALLSRTFYTVHAAFADETKCFMLYKVPSLFRDSPIYPDKYEAYVTNTLKDIF